MKRFFWVLNRKYRELTIASEHEDRWEILGGLEGWWTRAEVEEDYEIREEIQPPY